MAKTLLYIIFYYSGTFGNLIPTGTTCTTNSLSRTGRIVNGEAAVANSWPWIAQLIVENSHICGGSIIHEEWILSAAHCCEGLTTDRLVIKVGEHTMSHTSGYEKVVRAKQIVNHPSYISNGYQDNFDFCLIQTESVSLDRELIDIVCLPDLNKHVNPNDALDAGPMCFVAGWGYLTDESNQVQDQSAYLPDTLQSISVNVFSKEYCLATSKYSSRDIDPNSQFCGGHINGQRDSCQGEKNIFCKLEVFRLG